ncbi:MAG: flagellar biosynthesis/type III secretory pathway chaperone [Gammaproteobacteria bacterium]|jgi:flagellar biosynthesis/type III secretory pathway chaperone
MIAPAARANDDWMSGLRENVQAISLSLKAMMVLLVREREALVGRSDARSLESIAQDKQGAVTQVSALYELLRGAVSQHLGPGASLSDGISALRQHDSEIAHQVDELMQLTRKCQQANQDNGVLVSAGLAHSQDAIRTLSELGASPAVANTYGRTATQHPTTSRAQFDVRA